LGKKRTYSQCRSRIPPRQLRENSRALHLFRSQLIDSIQHGIKPKLTTCDPDEQKATKQDW
jgi:hypothetical protein